MQEIITDPETNLKLCAGCSLCCEYVNILIQKPTTREGIDKVVWYILHGLTLEIYKDGDWTVSMSLRCKALTDDKKCSIYETRPMICRNYSQTQCERYDPSNKEELAFKDANEFLAYVNSDPELSEIYNSHSTVK